MRTQVFEKTKMCRGLKDDRKPCKGKRGSFESSLARQVPHLGRVCEGPELSFRTLPASRPQLKPFSLRQLVGQSSGLS